MVDPNARRGRHALVGLDRRPRACRCNQHRQRWRPPPSPTIHAPVIDGRFGINHLAARHVGRRDALDGRRVLPGGGLVRHAGLVPAQLAGHRARDALGRPLPGIGERAGRQQAQAGAPQQDVGRRCAPAGAARPRSPRPAGRGSPRRWAGRARRGRRRCRAPRARRARSGRPGARRPPRPRPRRAAGPRRGDAAGRAGSRACGRAPRGPRARSGGRPPAWPSAARSSACRR